MNMRFICTGSCLLCLLFALIFTFLKGKAEILVSGFNTLPKRQRELYDREKISRDHRNVFFLWAFILGSGAVMSHIYSEYAGLLAFVLWLALALKDLHVDEEKAFAKYKKQ